MSVISGFCSSSVASVGILTASLLLKAMLFVMYYYYYYYYYYYSIIVSFKQGSHTHIPETNPVPREYIVAAILSLLFMVPLYLVPALVLLFVYVSTFGSRCAVLNMAVFCSSLTSWFPGMSLIVIIIIIIIIIM